MRPLYTSACAPISDPNGYSGSLLGEISTRYCASVVCPSSGRRWRTTGLYFLLLEACLENLKHRGSGADLLPIRHTSKTLACLSPSYKRRRTAMGSRVDLSRKQGRKDSWQYI